MAVAKRNDRDRRNRPAPKESPSEEKQSDDFDFEDLIPTTRRDARVLVMQLLYAAEMVDKAHAGTIDTLAPRLLHLPLAERPDLLDFARLLATRAWNNRPRTDRIIADLVRNWEVDRITLIDMAILRMGLAELLYFEDIPPRVTINEAIDIAKAYSTDKSGIFINGMLDAAISMLKKKGDLKKSGRGLV